MKKQRRMKDIEKRLQEYSTQKVINQDAIDLSIESAILSRDLEDEEIIVVGKFERALRFAEEKENSVDKSVENDDIVLLDIAKMFDSLKLLEHKTIETKKEANIFMDNNSVKNKKEI